VGDGGVVGGEGDVVGRVGAVGGVVLGEAEFAEDGGGGRIGDGDGAEVAPGTAGAEGHGVDLLGDDEDVAAGDAHGGVGADG
jgi:hypothetical protein